MLTKNQYWILILIAVIMLMVNIYFVLNLTRGNINKDCPLPLDEISHCECTREPFSDMLKYCYCYPRSSLLINEKDILKGVINGTG
jgi:hypothetical protein